MKNDLDPGEVSRGFNLYGCQQYPQIMTLCSQKLIYDLLYSRWKKKHFDQLRVLI